MNQLAAWIVGVSAVLIRWRFDFCRRHRVSCVRPCGYHHRDHGCDQQIVEAYCRNYAIPFYSLDPVKETSGNFQAWAREARYAFFARLAVQEAAAGVLIAQHLDDFLETALLQQESGRQCEVLGIREEGRVLGVVVVRPLLSWTKRQLQEYCNRHKIAYGIDESNLSDDYRRNAAAS
ncbi:MAG: tRNA lysidine(34) synthetase TilS [Merdibacter sp.]